MDTESEREREIYMFAISYLRAHSKKTNKSVKEKAKKNIKKEKEKRTFYVDYVRHKTKQTFFFCFCFLTFLWAKRKSNAKHTSYFPFLSPT